MTASAAEAFTLAMTEDADGTVIGNPSFGEFSDAIDWVLPNGTELTVSMEVYTDVAGNNYEATGVPVDVAALQPSHQVRCEQSDVEQLCQRYIGSVADRQVVF